MGEEDGWMEKIEGQRDGGGDGVAGEDGEVDG